MKSAIIKTSLFIWFLIITVSLHAQTSAQIKAEHEAKSKYWLKIINAHPDSLKAHKEYIWETGVTDTTLQKNYKLWVQRYPNLINIPLAIGDAYAQKEMPEAVEYLSRAVKIDSTRADIWANLAICMTIAADKFKANEYYKMASVLKPLNADYAFNYAYSFDKIDTVAFRAKLLDVAGRFPATMRGAQALYWLAQKSKDTLTKINIFERLCKEYKLKNDWSISGATLLYSLYLQTSPEKAVQLAEAYHWPPRRMQAQQIMAIYNLIGQKDYQQALVLVDSLKHRKDLYASDFLDYKQAELYNLTGNSKVAYDSLLVKMVKKPSYKLRDLLLTYGAKIGKTENDLNADIWTYLDKRAVTAPVFSSKLYTEDKRVSLRDYRGKVLLLTFWFPACGPCRAEFPHFEKVLKKFDRQQVAYIGVNGFPEQDGNVLKVIENDKLTFTALHGTQFMVQNLYNFDGYPSNYLIDQQGRIVFSNFYINDDNEDMLELMISLIINRDKRMSQKFIGDTARIKN